jgi:hypothetical protein
MRLQANDRFSHQFFNGVDERFSRVPKNRALPADRRSLTGATTLAWWKNKLYSGRFSFMPPGPRHTTVDALRAFVAGQPLLTVTATQDLPMNWPTALPALALPRWLCSAYRVAHRRLYIGVRAARTSMDDKSRHKSRQPDTNQNPGNKDAQHSAADRVAAYRFATAWVRP